MSVPQAGWYADPEDRERLRYFDGAEWTGHVRVARATFPLDIGSGGDSTAAQGPHAPSPTATGRSGPGIAAGVSLSLIVIAAAFAGGLALGQRSVTDQASGVLEDTDEGAIQPDGTADGTARFAPDASGAEDPYVPPTPRVGAVEVAPGIHGVLSQLSGTSPEPLVPWDGSLVRTLPGTGCPASWGASSVGDYPAAVYVEWVPIAPAAAGETVSVPLEGWGEALGPSLSVDAARWPAAEFAGALGPPSTPSEDVLWDGRVIGYPSRGGAIVLFLGDIGLVAGVEGGPVDSRAFFESLTVDIERFESSCL